MVFASVLVLLFFGGPVLRDFSICLAFGIFVSSYSTVTITTPMVYEWEQRYGAQAGKAAAAPQPSHEAAKKHQRRHT